MEPVNPPQTDNDRGSPPLNEELESLPKRVRELELKKSGKLLSWLGFLFGALSFTLNILLLFTPLAVYTYRRADVSVPRYGKAVTAEYSPVARTLHLEFEITVLNAGKRDGQIRGERAELESAQLSSSGSIPFDGRDIRFKLFNQSPMETLTIPKDDTLQNVTCILEYQVGDKGRPILLAPSPLHLTVRLRSDSKLLVIDRKIGWDSDILKSKSYIKRVFVDE